jgi:putative Mg2+ transporter-C (MgtC) family protein
MLSEYEVAARLAASVAAGAIIGWEREAHHKPAGIKTHMLVTLGSAGFMLAGIQLFEQLVAKEQAASADLLKLLAGIVGGIGFLGAGSILRKGDEVQGLTTAATIWMASATGVACGLGLYYLAAVAIGMALATLLILGMVQKLLGQSPPPAGSKPASSDSQESPPG